LLNRDITLEGTVVHLTLTNPVEEQLFQSLRTALTGFLREQLQNSAVSVQTRIETASGKRKLYTNREKFEYLAEKNPALREMERRMGLDADG
jgi:DNA polymerase-3 subunit gamma/tau